MSNHAGPASLYARMPAAAGMVGMYFCVGNANHLAPWGGLDMLLSTNPIAFAIPGHDEPAVVLDMATTVSSYGKIKVYAQQGKAMPVGWVIERDGRPLTDAKRAAEGLLLPLGGMEAGYKGYGLALVLGLLAGSLNDAAMGKEVVNFTDDDTSVTNTGHTIVAVDPAAFGDPTRVPAPRRRSRARSARVRAHAGRGAHPDAGRAEPRKAEGARRSRGSRFRHRSVRALTSWPAS